MDFRSSAVQIDNTLISSCFRLTFNQFRYKQNDRTHKLKTFLWVERDRRKFVPQNITKG